MLEDCELTHKQEGKESVIELADETSIAVKAMLQFAYTTNYEDLLMSEHDHPLFRVHPAHKSLLLHAQVYILANKFMMLSLKELAFSKFTAAALGWPILVPTSFIPAVQEIYNNTLKSDRIREVVLLTTARSLKSILNKEDGEFTQLMLDLPEFTVDFVKGVRFSDDFNNSSFSLSEIPPGDAPMKVYRCFICGTTWSIDATKEEPLCMRPDCITWNIKMDENLDPGFVMLHIMKCRGCGLVCAMDTVTGSGLCKCYSCGKVRFVPYVTNEASRIKMRGRGHGSEEQ